MSESVRSRAIRLALSEALGAAALVVLAALPALAQGKPVRITDLNQFGGPPAVHSEYAVLGDVALFAGRGDTGGIELWRTDGTFAGTVLVLDIRPGEASSEPECLTATESHVYFAATDGAYGRELWRSDGTAAGTEMIADIYPGSKSSHPCSFAEIGSRVVFNARTESGNALWSSDGTEAGTSLIADVRYLNYTGPVTFGGELYFRGFEDDAGWEPWATDGTAAGTRLVKDIVPGPGGSSPYNFAATSQGVLFVTTASADRHVWVSDGTDEGTVPLAGPRETCGEIRVIDDVAYFAAFSLSRCSLFMSDGTFDGGSTFITNVADDDAYSVRAIERLGNTLLYATNDDSLWTHDLDTGEAADLLYSSACYLGFLDRTYYDGDLFFGARVYDRDEFAWRLYRTDGTPEGTRALPPTSPGAKPLVRHIVPLGDRLLFAARTLAHGFEPWITDGTDDGTQLVRDIRTSNSPGVGLATQFRDRIHFQAATEPSWLLRTYGESLRHPKSWSSDGTAAGTGASPWANAAKWTSPIHGDEEQTFFLGSDSPYQWGGDSDLWVYRHESGAIEKLTDGAPFRVPHAWAYPVRHGIVFGADGVFVSDGTVAGTFRVGDDTSPFVGHIGDVALFIVDRDLWRTDGTAAGTTKLADLSVVYDTPVVSLGDHVLFVNGAWPPSLWRSDGTPSGTEQIFQIGGSVHRPAAARIGDVTYWLVRGTTQGGVLIRSDGTSAGTTQVVELPFNPYGPASQLVAAGERLLFAAYDETRGLEPWISDGTAIGTRPLADVNPGTGDSFPTRFHVVDDDVYFVAHDGVHGHELWFSDGTAEGTQLVDDIRPGPDPSNPRSLLTMPFGIAFTANDGLVGRELYRTTCGDGVVDEGEQCDLGADNGGGSCCTRSCRSVFPDADVTAGCGFELDGVQLRRRPGRGTSGDRLQMRARLVGGLPTEGEGRLRLGVSTDSETLAAVSTDDLYCEARARGRLCRSTDGHVRLRAVDRKDGSTSLRLRVRGLELPWPVDAPITVAVGASQARSLRVIAEDCRGDDLRLRCD